MHRMTLIVLASLIALSAHPQERGIGGTSAATASGETRIALVIGNAAYAEGRLQNPVNDAVDIAAALRACGFEVIEKTDCDLRTMKQALAEFGQRIQNASAALFYYAGHGIQAQGRNYLVPLGAVLNASDEIEYECLDAGRVLGKMESAGTQINIVILDACRNNPLTRSWNRSQSQGLAMMDAPDGSIISFATALGSVAADGTGRNGLYTAQLLQNIRSPGLGVEEMLKRTAAGVKQASDGKQVPWRSSSFTGEFYFVPGQIASRPPATSTPPPPPAAPVMVGHLQVAVNVPNARVIVDGRDSGTASPDRALNLQGLSLGSVTVTVKAEGYEPASQHITIARNEWTQCIFELDKEQPRTSDQKTFSGIEFVWIPPGEFTMGSPSSEKGRESNESQHHVTLSKGFWMGKYEVTNAQYRRYKSSHSSGDYKGHSLDGDSQPVVRVSWNDAKGYCGWLSRQGRGTFRLPTEAEWEYACRAGTTVARYWGSDDSSMGQYANTYDQTGKKTLNFDRDAANTTDGYSVASPVGRFKPNEWGLHDMIGNVWEWCSDWYEEDYYSQSAAKDPQGLSSGSSRVLRGGSWYYNPWFCRSANRFRHEPSSTFYSIGFRVVRSTAGR